jgi:phosphoglucosamine mutase
MKRKLFGSSGIRGIVNQDITPILTQNVGTAIASIYKGGTAIVGRDTRISSPMLEGALISGLTSGGTDTYILGLMPTPITAWMVKESGAETGIEITASHNPSKYNGLKIFNKLGMSLTEKERMQLENVIKNDLYDLAQWDSVGLVEYLDAIDFYIDTLVESIELFLDMKIACDLFNGATSVVASPLMDEFAIQVEFINGIPDGTFPSGAPEPNRESLRRLENFIKFRDIPIGFGFDGDGDRMMVVDNYRGFVSPDRVLAAYAAYMVEKNQGGTVITHIGASMNVNEMVEEAGGQVVRTPVGDSFITESIVENKAIFGGEPVGAWVHPDISLCPDGLLSALKLLEALQEKEMTLEEFFTQSPVYPLRREKIGCPNEKKTALLEFISMNYRYKFNNVQSVNNIDGIRLELEDGWLLIRPSGTEPIIRITVEAKNLERVKEYMEKGTSLVEKSLRELK